MKQRAVVICPGRGTYTKETLGYLQEKFPGKTKTQQEFLAFVDNYRQQHHQVSISELDASKAFSINQHLTGDNASALIYTCAMADFLSIDREKFDIVAVTGNSMGWYLALACAEAVTLEAGLHIVNTMGTRMHQHAPGGQVIYPVSNEQWQPDITREHHIVQTKQLLADDNIDIYDSIFLGGIRVLAANGQGVKKLLQTLPKTQDRYPFALAKHGAFHTPLMQNISQDAQQQMNCDDFTPPQIPLIDGCGRIWQNYGGNTPATQQEMFAYTFGQQVVAPYNFSKAIEVAVKEFAPDQCIILGPGSSLGAPTAQQLIAMQWSNLTSKQDFKQRQSKHPFILSMGIDEQRALVTHSK